VAVKDLSKLADEVTPSSHEDVLPAQYPRRVPVRSATRLKIDTPGLLRGATPLVALSAQRYDLFRLRSPQGPQGGCNRSQPLRRRLTYSEAKRATEDTRHILTVEDDDPRHAASSASPRNLVPPHLGVGWQLIERIKLYVGCGSGCFWERFAAVVGRRMGSVPRCPTAIPLIPASSPMQRGLPKRRRRRVRRDALDRKACRTRERVGIASKKSQRATGPTGIDPERKGDVFEPGSTDLPVAGIGGMS
jgi:hypothetical protein